MKQLTTQFATAIFVLTVVTTAATAAEMHHTIRLVDRWGQSRTLRAMKFSPDGKLLVVSTRRGMKFIRTKSSEVVRESPLKPFSVGFSRDGSRIFMISEQNSTLWDVERNIPLEFHRRQQPGFVGVTLEQHNGKMLVALAIETEDRKPEDSLAVGDEIIGIGEGKAGPIASVIGRDAKTVSSLLRGPAGTFVRVVIVPHGKFTRETRQLERLVMKTVGGRTTLHKPQVRNIDDNLVWCVRNGRHALASARTGQIMASLKAEQIRNVGQYAVSADAQKFAILAEMREGDGSGLEIFDVGSRKHELFLPLTISAWRQIEFSHDRSRLYIGTDSSVEVLDIEKAEFLAPIDLVAEPYALRILRRSGNAGNGDGYRSVQRQLVSMAVSSQGIVATGGPLGEVRLWEAQTGKLLLRISNDRAEVKEIEFSLDGKWLAYYVGGLLHISDVSGAKKAIEITENAEP